MMISKSQAITVLRMVRATQKRGESVDRIDEALHFLEGSTDPSPAERRHRDALERLVEEIRSLSDDDWRAVVCISAEDRPLSSPDA